MLIGAGFGTLFSPAGIEEFTGTICLIGGALGGALLEFLVRLGQRD
jgi:hypothetical protein